MGRIIYPDGSTINTKKVKGSIPYAWCVRDIMNDKFSEEYKIKLFNLIVEVGIFDVKLIPYIQKAVMETQNNELKAVGVRILQIFYREKINNKQEKNK